MTHVKKTSCAVVVWRCQLIPGDGHVSEPAEQLIRAPCEIGGRLMMQVSQPIGEEEEE